jgi:hypothetical protein
MIGLELLAYGCDGPRTTLLSESVSPGGKLIARSYRTETSGIGIGNPGTEVDLDWANSDSKSRTVVLSFVEGPKIPGGDLVGIHWLDPEHLELTYMGPINFDFQAIRAYGVDISARDLRNLPN